jgi:hypothetical protein
MIQKVIQSQLETNQKIANMKKAQWAHVSRFINDKIMYWYYRYYIESTH